MMGDPAQAEQMMQMTGVEASMGGMSAEDMMAMAQDQSEMGAVLSTLKDIDWVKMIVAFVIYFSLGYLLYASLFAAIGSAVENEADTSIILAKSTLEFELLDEHGRFCNPVLTK